MTEQADYWAVALAGAPALVEIPVDRPRTASAESGQGSVGITLDSASCGAVTELAAACGAERTEILLATWLVLAHRLSAQSVLLTSVLANPAEPVVPLCIELDPSASVRATVAQLQSLLADARRHAASAPVPAAGSESQQWQLGFEVDGAVSPSSVSSGRELTLQMGSGQREAEVRLAYAAALFDEATAQRYLGYWKNLLLAMTRDDGIAIGRLPMIDAAERHHLLEGGNATAVDYPQDVCLHTLIEAQVARTPDAVAVSAEDRQLSFQELNSLANQLARHLRALGVQPDDRVGICVERGWRMVVGLLAILKSGGAYVPLDPAYPSDRLAHMVKDSAPKVLLTQARLTSVLDGLEIACPMLDLDAVTADCSALPDTNPGVEVGVNARHLAYMIYTSGSTGLPKGAMNEHRGIVNRLLWMQDAYGLTAQDNVLQKTPFSFDVSVWEFFWPLLTGARLVMARPEGHKDPAYLSDLIVREKISTLHFVPSMLHAFLEDDSAAVCASVLKRVMCSGEALPASLVERFHQRLPGVELHNLYGPTEAAVDVTAWTCAPGASTLNIPIGRPIANTRMYVLDGYFEPVPQGVSGELYIGGVQVGRGYLNRDELTAERFLADPFVGGEARMYRTGDLGRWMPDGNIEYLGRNDFQVKIRGFRIELGEIEARLLEHDQVSAAVVLARPDAAGDLRLVAYYVPQHEGATVSVETLRSHLSQNLPDHMVPGIYVRLKALPVTPNGKMDRAALPEPGHERPDLATAYEPPATNEETEICAAFAAVLGVSGIGRHDNFFDLGGNSLLAMRLLERVRQWQAGRNGEGESVALSATLFFQHPTPAGLAADLAGESRGAVRNMRLRRRETQTAHEPIAILAMAGRFPGAADVEAFWSNLCEGRDSITKFKRDELDASISAAERDDPAYVAARGIIEGLEQFDAAFFGIGPREAELMDPQQRIFLELCWECLERGGYAPDATPVPVGVFAGMNNATYFQNHVSKRPDLIEKLGAFQVMVNNEKDYIATRVAHKLNLVGPAISTHTACSTSLVAICQAVDSLRAGQCDMALAGAASATCPPRSGYRHIEGAMLSPDGHTRAFDKDARGTVFSDGAAVVLLKRLSDALTDGDEVFAVIRGAAINNDGGHKASFTAPSSDGQAAVIAMALADAEVPARSISYVEAHGTATPLGDPIEIEGLTRAFRLDTQDTGFCRVGSVKSNVGHLVIAAGAAGVIKTALSLQQERLPATAHFRAPNPSIDFASTPFMVEGAMTEWKRTAVPRRAGVSSFGVGGTNAHVVMEEAPVLPDSDPAQGPQLLTLSARTPAVLERMAQQLAAHLDANPGLNLADAAWTLSVGRKAFAHRVAVVAEDAASAAMLLRAPETVAAIGRSRPAHAGGVVFMFPGQGSQYAGMGRALYAAEPHFRSAFDECANALRTELGFDLRDVVFGDDADALLPTSVMQPAIFSLEYSLARLWMSYGVMPSAMLGHSIGEFVAATLAGVFSLADALTLVARRGKLMQAQPKGSMLSVRMPMEALLARLPQELSLAAENAPGACVVSGETAAVAAFQAQLDAEGIACRALHTSHAFHSTMMDAVVPQFRAEVAAVQRHAPQMPVLSTATGRWLDAETATSPDYWANHLREPVRFSAAALQAIESSARVLLEVGTRTTLSALARQQPSLARANKVAISSLADSPASELASFRQAAGQLWAHASAFDPALLDTRAHRRRVRLPTYAFDRQRYWLDAPVADASNVLQHPALAVGAASGLHLVSAPLEEATETMPVSGEDAHARLLTRLRDVFEDAAGLSMDDPNSHFIEAGLDSLMLTQIALQLQKVFAVKVTFRQLMGEASSLEKLAALLLPQLPEQAPSPVVAPTMVTPMPLLSHGLPAASVATASTSTNTELHGLVDRQLQLMSQQLGLLAQSASQDGELIRQVVLQQQALMTRQLSMLGGETAGADVEFAPLDPDTVGSAPSASALVAAAPASQQDVPAASDVKIMEARQPIVSGARLGRSPQGEPGWYVASPDQPGKFFKVAG